jgi:hypothetical protein
MGYFSNGTEGQLYEARYCSRCDCQSVEPCAVLNAHFIAATQVGWADDMSPMRMILDMLIPQNRHGQNGECTMFKAEANSRRRSRCRPFAPLSMEDDNES